MLEIEVAGGQGMGLEDVIYELSSLGQTDNPGVITPGFIYSCVEVSWNTKLYGGQGPERSRRNPSGRVAPISPARFKNASLPGTATR